VALRSQPFRVILFDEVEKAHPRVFDALLQLLGEGRLTDASGHTADARQSVIIMTSNLGVREAASRAGFMGTGDDGKQHYLAAVQGFFRPEFFNRIDRVVPFRTLDRAALRVVVEHALGELLSRRGIQQGNVVVEVEPTLLDLLVEQAYDPRYGARPLRRALERQLTVPLAHHLVTRHGDELALVEVFRRDETLGLSVRVLADAPPATGGDGATPWTLEHLRAEVIRLRAAVAQLQRSPRVRAILEGARTAVHERHALLDDLDIVAEQLGALDDERIAELTYAEVPDDHDDRLRWREPRFEVPVTVRRRALERELAPQVLGLRDRLAVIGHQLEAPDDPCTLLFECVGLHDGGALEAAASAVMPELLRPRRFEEVLAVDGILRWEDPPPKSLPRNLRRLAFAYQRPGARRVLEALQGCALVRCAMGAREVTVPVRLELLSGRGPDAVAERDRRIAADREARRTGAGQGAAAAPGVVTLRRTSPSAQVVAMATGLLVSPEPAFAAALLRASRGRGEPT